MTEEEEQQMQTLVALAAGDRSAALARTAGMTDAQAEVLAAGYEAFLRAHPELPRAYRIWYGDLAESLRSIEHERKIEERQIATELGLPTSWAAVEALNDDEAGDDGLDQA